MFGDLGFGMRDSIWDLPITAHSTHLDSAVCTLHSRTNRILEPIRPEIDNRQQLKQFTINHSTATGTNIHCVQKKKPITFSFISPWKMFRLIQNSQGMFVSD